jgi:hypothetical protein
VLRRSNETPDTLDSVIWTVFISVDMPFRVSKSVSVALPDVYPPPVTVTNIIFPAIGMRGPTLVVEPLP